MDNARTATDCANSLIKGTCDDRVIEIYRWKEVKPNKPIEIIGPKEEQEISDICKDCSSFLEKQS